MSLFNFGPSGEVLIFDGATFGAKTDLIDGTNILPFRARYIALGQSVASTANADATFKFNIYNSILKGGYTSSEIETEYDWHGYAREQSPMFISLLMRNSLCFGAV